MPFTARAMTHKILYCGNNCGAKIYKDRDDGKLHNAENDRLHIETCSFLLQREKVNATENWVPSFLFENELKEIGEEIAAADKELSLAYDSIDQIRDQLISAYHQINQASNAYNRLRQKLDDRYANNAVIAEKWKMERREKGMAKLDAKAQRNQNNNQYYNV